MGAASGVKDGGALPCVTDVNAFCADGLVLVDDVLMAPAAVLVSVREALGTRLIVLALFVVAKGAACGRGGGGTKNNNGNHCEGSQGCKTARKHVLSACLRQPKRAKGEGRGDPGDGEWGE